MKGCAGIRVELVRPRASRNCAALVLRRPPRLAPYDAGDIDVVENDLAGAQQRYGNALDCCRRIT